MTTTYTNKTEAVNVVMDGVALGCHRVGKTAVRPTADGRFAVISTTGTRLIKSFADVQHARRYNFAIHGDTL